MSRSSISLTMSSRSLLMVILLCFPHLHSALVCELKEDWKGGWFQSGIQDPIYISRTEISVKGNCVESYGEKYVFRDKKLECYRCVVISEKHRNILQYKETLCEPVKDAETLCPQIPGDALLYSLFRRDAPPSPCPLKGPFTFSYSPGQGLCSSPPSTIDSCTSDSKLLFKYQACPDVLKTESSVEEVECIGEWKEGSTRYFVGKVDSRRAQTDEDRYRCFAWERIGRDKDDKDAEYRMAQSGDATCNGVFSAYDGSRTLQMRKVGRYAGCVYPSWVTEHRRWRALDTGVSYSVAHKNTTLKLHHNHAHSQASERLLIDSSQARLVCALLKESSPEKAVAVSYSTTECISGYVCTVFYKRDNNTIEIQQGSRAIESSDACTPSYFNASTVPHTTLTSNDSPHTDCPIDGVWTSESNECPGITHLHAGCKGNAHTLHFFASCQKEALKQGTTANSKQAFTCHGSWKEGDKTFVVVSPEGRTHRLCLVASYNPRIHEGNDDDENETENNQTLIITTHAHSCPRQVVPPTTTVNVSFTSHSSCLSLNKGTYLTPALEAIMAGSLLLIAIYYSHRNETTR